MSVFRAATSNEWPSKSDHNIHSVTYCVIRWSLVQALTTNNVAAIIGLFVPSTGLRTHSLSSSQDISPVTDKTNIISMTKEATFSLTPQTSHLIYKFREPPFQDTDNIISHLVRQTGLPYMKRSTFWRCINCDCWMVILILVLTLNVELGWNIFRLPTEQLSKFSSTRFRWYYMVLKTYSLLFSNCASQSVREYTSSCTYWWWEVVPSPLQYDRRRRKHDPKCELFCKASVVSYCSQSVDYFPNHANLAPLYTALQSTNGV